MKRMWTLHWNQKFTGVLWMENGQKTVWRWRATPYFSSMCWCLQSCKKLRAFWPTGICTLATTKTDNHWKLHHCWASQTPSTVHMWWCYNTWFHCSWAKEESYLFARAFPMSVIGSGPTLKKWELFAGFACLSVAGFIDVTWNSQNNLQYRHVWLACIFLAMRNTAWMNHESVQWIFFFIMISGYNGDLQRPTAHKIYYDQW